MTVHDSIAKHPPAGLFELVTDQWTAPFWAAAREHRLTVARCSECAVMRMPPTPFCPNCLSQEIDWPTLSGLGSIYSYTIVSRSMVPEMDAAIPYIPAIVTLADAASIRLITNIVDVPISTISVGAEVKVVWCDMPGGVVVPRFTLTTTT